jgi:hypothetical protein
MPPRNGIHVDDEHLDAGAAHLNRCRKTGQTRPDDDRIGRCGLLGGWPVSIQDDRTANAHDKSKTLNHGEYKKKKAGRLPTRPSSEYRIPDPGSPIPDPGSPIPAL